MGDPFTKPRNGDVLVSKVTASVEHEVSIVPGPAEVVCRNQDNAVSRAKRLAQKRHADAWLTEDHTHFKKIASYRAEGSQSKAG